MSGPFAWVSVRQLLKVLGVSGVLKTCHILVGHFKSLSQVLESLHCVSTSLGIQQHMPKPDVTTRW